ncbi:MAG: hypothetical protein AAF202_01130, partial [Pseudomonadota bacterium]
FDDEADGLFRELAAHEERRVPPPPPPRDYTKQRNTRQAEPPQPQYPEAYIPSYKMMMSRLAENHGRGIYQVYQDVVCPADPQPYIVREIWTVETEDSMRVTLFGKGELKDKVSGSIVYSKGQRYFRNQEGSIRTSKAGKDFVEQFFHFRFSKNIKPQLVALGIAPATSLDPRRPSRGKDGQTVYPEENFIRLARVGGHIAWAIGKPASPDGSDRPPGFWIEQDRFNVLQVRMPSTATVKANDYDSFDKNMNFPRNRQYTFGESTCEVQVDKVTRRATTKTFKEILSTASLKDAEKSKPLIMPEISLVREFYSRFR